MNLTENIYESLTVYDFDQIRNTLDDSSVDIEEMLHFLEDVWDNLNKEQKLKYIRDLKKELKQYGERETWH